MTNGTATIAQRALRWLQSHNAAVAGIGVPTLVLCIDVFLRAILSIDLVDTGSDLALLALSCMLSPVLVGEPGQQTDQARVRSLDATSLAMCLFFLFAWFVSLYFVSRASIAVRESSQVAWTVGGILVGTGALSLSTLVLPAVLDSTA